MSSSALPDGKDVRLSWRAENLVDFSHFEVQRSTQGFSWTTISIVSPEQPFLCADAGAMELGEERLYYRLGMPDLDGTVAYSLIESVDLSSKQFQVSPNPFDNSFTLSTTVAGDFELLDVNGRRIAQLIHLGEGDQTYSFSLSPGIYIIREKSTGQFRRLIRK